MTENITRLPKGHKVIFAYKCDENHREWLRKKGVSWTEDDEKLFIECFVVGDTPEKGLSIVALDNSLFCLCHAPDSRKESVIDRLEAMQGYMKGPSLTLNYFGYPQICPY